MLYAAAMAMASEAMWRERVALVTGSTRGWGRAVAVALAQMGARVCVHGRTASAAGDAVVATIRAQGGSAAFFPFDVRDTAAVETGVAAIEQTVGPIDIGVFMAGRYDTAALPELTASEWSAALETTLSGTFHCCQTLLPRMRARQRGRIITVGCVGCERIYHGVRSVAYRIAVSGNLALTKAYAQLAARDGVTVNLIAPGFLENTVDTIDATQLPAGRLSHFDDVFPAIRFLLSPEAAHVNGTCLTVSGGYVR